MSYEGYEEYLCANGHLRTCDCWNPLTSCSCGEPFVFRHSVNETNGPEEDNPSTLPYPFEVDVPEKTEICSLGYVHETEEVRYKIPSRE